ncbi:Tim10/DDP family zinc finger protein [archaeon]|nr:MAG: Tim10/DDP family zinc finger protein [archaeon]
MCAGKKGDGLDSNEMNCTVNCMDRYLDTLQEVGQALGNKQH